MYVILNTTEQTINAKVYGLFWSLKGVHFELASRCIKDWYIDLSSICPSIQNFESLHFPNIPD